MGGEYEPLGRRHSGKGRAVPVRCPSIRRSSSRGADMHDDKQGRKMNIDLDSWEAGYADGQYGRSPQCAIGLHQVSYLSGGLVAKN
jgi:hypothetical protein